MLERVDEELTRVLIPKHLRCEREKSCLCTWLMRIACVRGRMKRISRKYASVYMCFSSRKKHFRILPRFQFHVAVESCCGHHPTGKGPGFLDIVHVRLLVDTGNSRHRYSKQDRKRAPIWPSVTPKVGETLKSRTSLIEQRC